MSYAARAMAQFRKKPVIIQAVQWFKNGDHPEDYSDLSMRDTSYSAEQQREQKWEGDVVRYYMDPAVPGDKPCGHCERRMDDHGWIDTLEGGHIVCPGDWVITGVKGERYPCKPDIFEATYEPIEVNAANGAAT